MKKRKLKKWVVRTLKGLCVIAIIIGASDCENYKLFIITHAVAIVVLAICTFILIKNGEGEL